MKELSLRAWRKLEAEIANKINVARKESATTANLSAYEQDVSGAYARMSGSVRSDLDNTARLIGIRRKIRDEISVINRSAAIDVLISEKKFLEDSRALIDHTLTNLTEYAPGDVGSYFSAKKEKFMATPAQTSRFYGAESTGDTIKVPVYSEADKVIFTAESKALAARLVEVEEQLVSLNITVKVGILSDSDMQFLESVGVI